MKKQTHGLTNREIDDSGVVNEYEEFTLGDVDNIFRKLEQPDYEIRASDEAQIHDKEDDMKGTRKDASYVGELSSGYDATVQDDYEAGQGQKGQDGKAHEEQVDAPNWKNDKRDEIGRAAAATTLRRTAARLSKMADMMEAGDDIDEELDILESGDEADFEEVASAEGTEKSAAHPSENDQKDPSANMPSDTGDEWIDIGPGEFDDKRNDVGGAGDNE